MAETEDAVRELAGEFKRVLDKLPPDDLHLLVQTSPPGAAGERDGQKPRAAAGASRAWGEAVLAKVEDFLAELAELHGQLSAREAIEGELIHGAAKRLAEIGQRLARDGLSVAGSKSQLRPHPLLSFEAGLRRELTENLRQLEFRVRNRALFERMQTAWAARSRRTEAGAARGPDSGPSEAESQGQATWRGHLEDLLDR